MDRPPTAKFPAVGEGVARYEARAKVTGRILYPADVQVADPLWAYAVTSNIARGRIIRVDDAKAKAIPGVIAVYSHSTPPDVAPPLFLFKGGGAMSSLHPLASPLIHHDGQLIAMVVAESYEIAREAAFTLNIEQSAEPPSPHLGSVGNETVALASVSPFHRDLSVGDAEAALDAAPVTIGGEYLTATQHHNPMELFSTTAVWEGDDLTIHESSQFVYALQNEVARQLGIPAAKVHIVSPFVGGAFGSKGPVTPRTAIVAWIARQLNRPVKLVYTRSQGFTTVTSRAETRHKVRLGATRDGKITAYSHDAWELTSRYDDFAVGGTASTAHLYAIPNIRTMVRIERADCATPGYMRSPVEVPYMYALESAIDELACALAIDPIELRRRNDTQHSPINGAPFSSRSLMRCYEEAASAFGWERRDPRPGAMRDGEWAIGWGCATAIGPTNMMPATARVRLGRDGKVVVQTAAADVGTGAYTVIGQIAAQILGVPLDQVVVQLGDSSLPPGPAAGGSRTTASACSAVKMACDKVVARFGGSPLHGPDLAKMFDRVAVVEEYAEYSPSPDPGAVSALYAGSFRGATGGTTGPVLMQAFGAEMVEVRINRYTREIRIPRIVGAFACGRILNERTARSQLTGGMIWGISSALHEATEMDRKLGRYTNKDFGEYLIAVNADVPHVQAIIVPETDDSLNPVGVKGIGELANVGTEAAIANAVYHATGKRVRDLPICLNKLYRDA